MRSISTIRSESAAARSAQSGHSARAAPSDHPARADRSAVAFVLRVLVWIVALFGLLRLPWVQSHLLIPFAGLQQNLGCLITGASKSAVTVDLSCTGSDAMALCLGTVLAFPVPWRRRLIGGAVGLALVTAVNTARIGSLSLVAADNGNLFRFLHIYLWPTALIVVAAGYVFLWMSWAGASASDRTSLWPLSRNATSQRTWRFLVATLSLAVLYYAGSRWFLQSPALLAVAEWSAAAAGLMLSFFGIEAEVTNNILRTAHGAWLVSQECVATPLIPVYLAAVWVAPLPLGRRFLGWLAALPLFAFLATARLLVLALPAAMVGSHMVAVHAFYQVVTALLVVGLAAGTDVGSRNTGNSSARKNRLGRFGIAVLAGVLAAVLVGTLGREWLSPLFDQLAQSLHLGHVGHGYRDAQGALAILPAFEMGLFVALLVTLRRRIDRVALSAFAILLLSQAAALAAFGEWAIHSGFEPPVVLIRVVALSMPLLLAWIPWHSDDHRL